MNKSFLYALLLLPLVFLVACGERADKAKPQIETTEQPPAAEAPDTQEPAVEEESIWVVEARGNRQCEGGGISLEESSAKLSGNGVKVLESRCGVRTDRMYPSVCGGATGDILLHRVSQSHMDAALELGFDPAAQVQYSMSACPGS